MLDYREIRPCPPVARSVECLWTLAGRLARILRFQRVFRAIESEPAPASAVSPFSGHRPNWAAVAVECGYYDQAHLIRDFHQFAGQPPAVLLAADGAPTRLFTRSHRPA